MLCCLYCSSIIHSAKFRLLSESDIHSVLPLRDTVHAEDLMDGLHFKYCARTHDAQWKEGMNYFC